MYGKVSVFQMKILHKEMDDFKDLDVSCKLASLSMITYREVDLCI